MIDAANSYDSYGAYIGNYESRRIDCANGDEQMTQSEIRAKKRSGEIECQTCKSRKYVDGSDDAGVSFKTPQHVGASQSASAVIGHEMQHYSRETADAKLNGGEVVSASISIDRKTCPECGRSYVAGGQTRVTKRFDKDKKAESEYFKNQFYNATAGKYEIGKNIDKRA